MSRKPKPIALTIIEDNRFVREGWHALLTAEDGIDILGAFAACEEAFRSRSLADSDVVLMDIRLPGMSGIEGTAYLKQQYPHIATVMCTVHEDDRKIFDALCAGAVGYLLKKTSSDDFIRAIREAASGGSPMSPDIARRVISTFHIIPPATQGDDPLTKGEQDVLALLAVGKSYAAIAEELFLSLDGVRARIRKIYDKLHAHSRGEAVAKGVAKRIIDFPK
ncbi:MAG: response regulator transcription factor [Ignavibacteriae bacterium]|nr:response regulator transcription factor [Ignavibacteriota bacterium]